MDERSGAAHEHPCPDPVTGPVLDPGIQAAIDGELRLLRPEVRRDPHEFLRLLHPAFSEIGASGRLWDRASVREVLSPATGPEDTPSRVAGMTGTRLAEDLVQLRFVTDDGRRVVRRSSLWRRTGEGWRLWFHQGTPCPEAAPPD